MRNNHFKDRTKSKIKDLMLKQKYRQIPRRIKDINKRINITNRIQNHKWNTYKKTILVNCRKEKNNKAMNKVMKITVNIRKTNK